MATTYLNRLDSAVETLTARVFADDVEIYPTHELRQCTRYQWFYDDLMNGPVEVAGATNQTYDVDISAVSNSGEYYCEISIGTTEECDQTTERRRITIIDCLDQTARTVPSTGGTLEFRVDAPHYETPVFSNENNSWITGSGSVTCDTQAPNVCRYVQNSNIAASPTNAARRAQTTMTVGDLICFYSVVQGFTVTAPPAPDPAPDPIPGPFVNLTTNGPTLALVVFGSGVPQTVTATVGTVGDSGAPYSVTFSAAGVTQTVSGVPEGGTATFDVANPGATADGMGQDIPVTVTVTSSNGTTATEMIDAVFNIFRFINQTDIAGDTVGTVNWGVLRGIGPNAIRQGIRRVTGSFTITGYGNWNTSLNLRDGFIGQPATSGNLRLTINGPGVSVDETATIANPAIEIEQTQKVGVYNWTLEISDIQPTGRIIPLSTGTMITTPRLF